MKLGYYTPTIPDVENTTRFRHAWAIGTKTNAQILITERQPPDKFSDLYPTIHVLDGKGMKSKLSKTMKARRIADHALGKSGTFVTGMGFASIFAGALSKPRWVADIFDDPTQYRAENRNSIVRDIAVRMALISLRRADLAYITQHPSSPLLSGKNRIYGRNGAPVEKIFPSQKPPRGPLHAVVSGKTRLSDGMRTTLQGIAGANVTVKLDVFGEPYTSSQQFAQRLNIADQVTFHGWTNPKSIYDILSRAHVGFCLLPHRRDWDYAYPIKLGEYLAAGTIPLCTPSPAMTDLASDTGVYCSSVAEVANILDQLASLSEDEFLTKSAAARKRAEEVAWSQEMEKFINVIEQLD